MSSPKHNPQGKISIHAPSRERPCYHPLQAWQSKISIHAPSRERPSATSITINQFRISIHAPSRERLSGRYYFGLYQHFNPRSLAGATLFPHPRRKFAIFQSTLPRGSDFLAHHLRNLLMLFQSTLPRGSDSTDIHLVKLQVFQSTLPRGSDYHYTIAAPVTITISIHAPSRERQH